MRLMRKALAVCLAIAMTLAQSCAGPAQNVNAYRTTGASGAVAAPTGNTPGAAVASGLPAAHIDTTGYRQDQSTSQALTDYLTQHKLPLVGAQVLTAPDGSRAVVLYGFAGSEAGKQGAVGKARGYLKDSTVAVDNRVKVNPDLLTANNTGAAAGKNPDDAAADISADANDTSTNGAADSYTQHQKESQQYAQQMQQMQQAQGNGPSMSAMTPMLLMGLLALSLASGGHFAVGSGSGSMGFGGPPFGGPPFGGAPSNPYQGYPSGSASNPLGGP
jgi:hypothetical protein